MQLLRQINDPNSDDEDQPNASNPSAFQFPSSISSETAQTEMYAYLEANNGNNINEEELIFNGEREESKEETLQQKKVSNKNNFCTFALNSFFTVRSVAWLNIILFPYRPEVSGFHIGVVVDCVTMQLHHHSLVQFLAV